jgi:hypothetical protein
MEKREVNMKNTNKILLSAVIVIVLASAGVYYFMSSRPGDTGKDVSPERADSGVIPEAGEEIEPIDIDLAGSDALVRQLAGTLSSYPSIARWLATDGVLRRFVTAVDLIAKGESPRRPLNFIEVDGEFRPLERDGNEFLDPASYRRYDRVAAAVASLDAAGCAKLYRRLRLPINEAYREMGYPDEDFDKTMKKAFLNLLATPVAEGTLYLERDVVTYTMKDSKMEELNPAEKHLLRMGPENMKMVQSKLREIMQYLDF